jgi:hypothetical protein
MHFLRAQSVDVASVDEITLGTKNLTLNFRLYLIVVQGTSSKYDGLVEFNVLAMFINFFLRCIA